MPFNLPSRRFEMPAHAEVNFDWIEPARKVRIRIDQDQARLLGLSSESIAAMLNTVMSGATVTQVRDGIYLVDVIVRATDEQRISLSTLRNLQFPLRNGRTVPLGQFAVLDFEQEFPLIWRRERRSDTDLAGRRDARASPEGVVAALAPAVAKLNASLPKLSYRRGWHGRGKPAIASLGFCGRSADAVHHDYLPDDPAAEFQPAFPGLERRSDGPYRHCRCASHFRISLSGFVAILGILALIGMIARNAVILIDQIEAERAEGKAALGRGGRSGDVPLPSDHADGDIDGARHDSDRPDRILGADGLRDHGRLLVATVLTLIFLPALYVAWFRVKEPVVAV